MSISLFSGAHTIYVLVWGVGDSGESLSNLDGQGFVLWLRAQGPPQEGDNNNKQTQHADGELGHQADERQEQANSGDKRPDAGSRACRMRCEQNLLFGS